MQYTGYNYGGRPIFREGNTYYLAVSEHRRPDTAKKRRQWLEEREGGIYLVRKQGKKYSVLKPANKTVYSRMRKEG